MEAILSLGSNLGDRRANLAAARDALARLPHVRLVAASRLYETAPVLASGAPPQPDFLNAVVILETSLTAPALAAAMHAIETLVGRVRTGQRDEPRVIDIDLICAGDLFLDTTDLKLPHPRAAGRRFVCEPLAELRPDLVLPGQRQTVRDLLAELPPSPAVRPAAATW